MAQTLEKLFKSKLAQMPKDEIRIDNSANKVVKKKSKPPLTPGAVPIVGGSMVPSVPKVPSQKSTLPQNTNAQVSSILPSDNTGMIPASTNKSVTTLATTSSTLTTNSNLHQQQQQQNLHNLIMPTQTNNNSSSSNSNNNNNNSNAQMSVPSAPSYLVNQPIINNIAIPSQQPAKVKKGVKRKADTTTPMPVAFDSGYASTDAKISTRGRQVSSTKLQRFFFVQFHSFLFLIILGYFTGKCVSDFSGNAWSQCNEPTRYF
jgi:bromodomain-containing protein 4